MGKGKNRQNQNSVENQENGEKKAEEGKKETENSHKEVVLKAYIHCEGCCDKVSKCLKGFQGVEDVVIDSEHQKVIVKGKKTDPIKVLERVKRKYSRNVELISPKPKPSNTQETKQQEKKPEIQVKTVVLKMNLHCEGCEHDVTKYLQRMIGVMSVEADMKNSKVKVKGAMDGGKLVETIKKKMNQHVEIVKQDSMVEKDKVNTKVANNNNNNNNKKENENIFHYPPQYSIDYIYPSMIFNDENAFWCSIM